MNDLATERLREDFPALYAGKSQYDNAEEEFWGTIKNGKESPREELRNGFECGDGWYELIREMSYELYQLPNVPSVRQLKEKFGTLSVYTNSNDQTVWEIAARYEVQSQVICEECGQPGQIRNNGYGIQTLCDEHYPIEAK